MNGVHDLGGLDGFGEVVSGPGTEAPFHAPWEGRVLAMTRCLQGAGAWNIDQFRSRIERLPPHVYLSSSYYMKWFLQAEWHCLEHGLVTSEELAAGHAMTSAPSLPRATVTRDDIGRVLVRPSYARPPGAPPLFRVGERIRAKNMHPKHHTRLPRFVRGHIGLIERIQGCHVFPDAVVARAEEDPQWLYTVVFESQELWGGDGESGVDVSVEAFEPYLEPL